MRYVFFAVLNIMLACNSDKQSVHLRTSERASFLDTLRTESRRAQLLFFRDYTASKISILVKDANDKKNIDSLLAFIGNEKTDTACHLFAGQNPVGEIYFYKDTSMTEILADLYFSIDGKCNGLYNGIDKDSPKYDLTDEGKLFLSEAKNRLEQHWKN